MRHCQILIVPDSHNAVPDSPIRRRLNLSYFAALGFILSPLAPLLASNGPSGVAFARVLVDKDTPVNPGDQWEALVGFLSQLVGAVVDAVETATGNKNSETGDALEEQAAAAEQSASDAADTAAEAASEAAGFVAAVMDQAKDTATGTVGEWVTDGLNDAGIQVPNKLDLQGTVNLVVAIGEVTGRRTTEKLERIIGPAPVRVGKSIVNAVVREGPHGAFDVVKEIITGTIDADGQLQDWMRQVGKVASETDPADRMRELLQRAAGGPVSLVEALKELLGGRQTDGSRTGKSKPVPQLAARAEQERRKFIEELRRAVACLQRTQPMNRSSPIIVPSRGHSITPDGVELQRLVQVAMQPRPRTPSQRDPAVARHLAAATVAAIHSAVLCAQLQLWLNMIARLARVRKVSGGPSRRQLASPSLGNVRLPHTARSRSGR